ncbi:MAG: hypothetical protein M3020_03655 [Myxococcota bacterium]|nr:hypothetical protein [Myxococcota bacterium]
MTPKRSFPFFLLLVASWSCGEDRGPQTSSTSHWVTCSIDEDCTEVRGAVACSKGYCVDADGTRVDGSASQAGSDTGGQSSGGAAPTGGRSAARGGAGGEAGAPITADCPAAPPADGTPCTPPWEVPIRPGLGEVVNAHCSWGQDTRRSCRMRALCEGGVWQVTAPEPGSCGECPPFEPQGGQVCPAAGLQCGQCFCSPCEGGDGSPECPPVDPPQWFCPELPAECPFPAAQAGSRCSVEGAECGETCGARVRCEAGVWQWLDCTACCTE